MSVLDLSFIQGNLPIPIKSVGDKEEPWKGPNKLLLCSAEPAYIKASPVRSSFGAEKMVLYPPSSCHIYTVGFH